MTASDSAPDGARPDEADAPVSMAVLAQRALRAARAGDAETAAATSDADELLDDSASSEIEDKRPEGDARTELAAERPEGDAPTVIAAERPVETVDDPSGAEPARTVAGRARWRTGLVAASIAAIAAAGFAVAGLVVWWQATHDSTLDQARARDAVALQARLDIATVNTLDYRNVAAGLQTWEAATTGPLHDQIVHASAAEKATIAGAKVITTAQVLAVAVTDLDLSHGRADVIASVQVTKKPTSGASTIDRNRVTAMLRLVHGVWKVADLSPVTVQLP